MGACGRTACVAQSSIRSTSMCTRSPRVANRYGALVLLRRPRGRDHPRGTGARGDRLRGWACRISTSESCWELPNWSYVTNSACAAGFERSSHFASRRPCCLAGAAGDLRMAEWKAGAPQFTDDGRKVTSMLRQLRGQAHVLRHHRARLFLSDGQIGKDITAARHKTSVDSDFQDTNSCAPRNGADGMAVSRKEIPDGSPRLVPRKGADILPDVDGRRYRDIAAQIIADMGGASQMRRSTPSTHSPLRGCSRSCRADGSTIGKRPLDQHHWSDIRSLLGQSLLPESCPR